MQEQPIDDADANDGGDGGDTSDAGEPRQRSHRSWLFSGSPPSNWTVGTLAFVYAAVMSWWSGAEQSIGPLLLWRESPTLAVIFIGALAVLSLLMLYFSLRIFLAQCKPRITKRWRSQPLVFRTASLAQSIIMFRTLQALPALMTGFACGMLLTATAGVAGLDPEIESGAVAIQAGCVLLGSLVALRANRDAERSKYRPLLELR